MSFTNQINSLSKSCHFHIRDIRRIRHLLPLSAATALANSLVSSKLDYCNSLYNGISQANLNKIQRIQNTLARVVTNTTKFEHITPILKKLHWLPIKQRIDYKLCLLTYKTLQIQQDIITKAYQRIAILFRGFCTKTRTFLLHAYKTYVRPVLEYCTQIWSPYLIKDIKALEKVQKYFTKKIPGLRSFSYEQRLQILNLESLELRRVEADLTMYFKIINNFVDFEF